MEETAQVQEQTAAPADEGLKAHFDGLWQQSQALRRDEPDFDLLKAIEDPVFVALTQPGVNVSVQRAHAIARQLQAQSPSRPVEAGLSGRAPSLARFSWRDATAQQREAQKKAIRTAAAQGRKLYPREQ